MPQLFNFSALLTSANSLVQDANTCFGAKGANKFRLTSSFQIISDVMAYAVTDGTVLLQQVQGKPELVNLILKPRKQIDSFFPIKYVTYRGLKKLDFLTTNTIDIANPATTVASSGGQFINEMQAIQQVRSPGTPIEVKALFGYDLAPADSKNLDDFFFKDVSPSSQLMDAKLGWSLGNFKGGELIGLDIILENPEFFPTVGVANKQFYELDNASGSTLDKRYLREQVRHFVDPAGYYGLYAASGIGYPGGTASTKQDIHSKILSPFHTRNTIYLDIRNENGYSYNYYNNYIGNTGIPADDEKELKIGSTSTNLNLREYYTDDWPVHIVDVVSPSTSAQENIFYFSLRINDNEKPLLFGRKAKIEPITSKDNDGTFIDELSLIGTDPHWTKEVTIKVPNIPAAGGGSQMGTIVRLDYIKQIRYNETATDSFPHKERTDFVFGPINVPIRWEGDGTKWIGSNHQKFLDGASQGFIAGAEESSIVLIEPALKRITVNGTIATGTQIADKVSIVNTTNIQNVGNYTVIKVDTTATQILITVREPIPSVAQPGDTLRIKIEATFYRDSIDRKKLIVPQVNLTILTPFQVSKKVLLYSIENSKGILNVVQSIQFVSGSTIIQLTRDVVDFGFGAIMETGIVEEKDLSSTGSVVDRVLLYSVPQYYFLSKGVQKRNYFNFKGGVTHKKSLIDHLRTFTSEFIIEKHSLQLQGTPSNTFIATLSYSTRLVSKQNYFILGITKAEWQSLTSAAATELSTFHIPVCKLIPQGNHLRDVDYEAYYKYKLVVAGLDNAGAYKQTTTFVEVYSRDGVLFTSPQYAQTDFISQQEADNALDLFINSFDFSRITYKTVEEQAYLTDPDPKKNKALLNIDPVVKNLINELRNELDLVQNSYEQIEELIIQKADELLTLSKQRIRQNNVLPGTSLSTKNKDGILYIARLAMQVVLKNHVKIINNNVWVTQLSNLFEKVSRGLDRSTKVNFTAYPGLKRILISGYDPFDKISRGRDAQEFISNPSGNIALALDGEILTEGGKTGVVRSVLFPVRWQDFDFDIVEETFRPFIQLNSDGSKNVDLVITFSYGVHYNSRIPHDYHIERFAANFRGGGPANNSLNRDVWAGERPIVPLDIATREWSFIETTLPYETLADVTNSFIQVPNYNVTLNHGPKGEGPPQITEGAQMMIIGKDPVTNEYKNLSGIYNVPSSLTPQPFQNPSGTQNSSKPSLLRSTNSVSLIWDSKDLKQSRNTLPGGAINNEYIPLPTWNDYKDLTLDSNFNDVHIQALNGSGGDYLSNEIFYRVAYLRKSLNTGLPTGHIHIGFNDLDPHTDRDGMLQDIIHIIKKFLGSL